MATFLPSNNRRPVPAKGARGASAAGRDRWRAVIVGLLLAALLGFSLIIGSSFPSPMRTAGTPDTRGGDLASGPVVFVPRSGNRCRQRAIDNATWQMRDAGEVDCDTALSQQKEAIPRESSPSRVEVIRDGFRKK